MSLRLGTIIRYSLADAVGRIALDDGEELRFGATALRGVLPVEGTRVRVGRIEPHPLGGSRALDIELAGPDAAPEGAVQRFLENAGEAQRADEAHREQERRRMQESVRPAPLTAVEAVELARRDLQREEDEAAARREDERFD